MTIAQLSLFWPQVTFHEVPWEHKDGVVCWYVARVPKSTENNDALFLLGVHCDPTAHCEHTICLSAWWPKFSRLREHHHRREPTETTCSARINEVDRAPPSILHFASRIARIAGYTPLWPSLRTRYCFYDYHGSPWRYCYDGATVTRPGVLDFCALAATM